MGEPVTTDHATLQPAAPPTSGPNQAHDESRELRYLRRDVERLSLRLRQEQETTSQLEARVEELRGELDLARAEQESVAEVQRAEASALAEQRRVAVHEREQHQATERKLGETTTALRWARIVSFAAVIGLAFVALWTVL